MKRTISRISLVLIILCSLTGIAGLTTILYPETSPSTRVQPPVIVECLDRSIEPYAEMWRVETARRFDNAVVIICHGGDFEAGRFIVGAGLQPWKHVSTAAEVVRHFQTLYPTRTLVLVACNPGHLKLRIPGVYYALNNVWVYPDRDIQRAEAAGEVLATWTSDWKHLLEGDSTRSRSEVSPDFVGSIFEFVKE
jgi:hypothetical protein